MFIAVDGIDGAGKTTLVRLLAEALSPLSVITTKEPTDNSKWGQRLRKAAVEGRLPPDKELEYFRKDREHHIDNIIKPALASGSIVITDRYVDSTLAFQAQTPEEADSLYERIVDDIVIPDITFILLCDVEIGLQRVRTRDGDNLTQFENVKVLDRAEKIYASREGDNYALINASISPDNTFQQAITAIKERLSSDHKVMQVLSNTPSSQHEKGCAYC